MNSKYVISIIALVLVLSLSFLYINNFSSHSQDHSDYHAHADFKLYVGSQFYNLSQEQFMSDSTESALTPRVHLHDLNSNVIHYHSRQVSLGYFIESLGFNFNESCFVTVENNSYCLDDGYVIKTIVNGEEVTNGYEYVAEDLDRILIYVGLEENFSFDLFDLVTNDSCLYSEKCPERGSAPPGSESSCVGSSCEIIF